MSGLLICDVAPRDGLQNEAVLFTPAQRADLSARLAHAGLPRVEAVSFVDPRRVPAMAGAEDVLERLGGSADGPWSGLILNERGFDRAIATGLRRINLTVGVTDSFCQRNQRCSRLDVERLVTRVGERADAAGVTLTVALAVSFGCPFEGRVAPAQTLSLAGIAVAAGADEVVLADTIGVAVPSTVGALTEAVLAMGVHVGGHFHDTRSTGIANCWSALEAGATVLDASAGGIGGCPFAPGATGNVATEDLLYLLEEEGVQTGVDLEAVIACARQLGEQLGRTLPSAVVRAGPFPIPTPVA
jgi:isopropylmalate/homocitrate/citramalate synthase